MTVITCAPNFPRGKVFEGYRNRLFQREEMAGISVIRVWSYITSNEGFAKRILDYVSFMVSAVIASPIVRRPDVVIGTSPQFFTACAACWVGITKGIPFVFELRDLWPESIRAVGAMKQSRILDWIEKLELFLYRKATLVVSVTQSFRDNLSERGIDPAKIEIVTNGVDIARFNPIDKDAALVARYKLEGKFVAGYIGTHGMAHRLETILDAAADLARAPGGDVFHFLFVGDGAQKAALIEHARALQLTNVTFVESVAKEEVVKYWSLLDAAVIHLRRTDLFKSVIPSKLFECMGMGIPVLHGVEGESAHIVEDEQVGVLFEPENVDMLCSQLALLQADGDLRQRLAKNGPIAAQRYDRKHLALRMLSIIEALITNRRT